MAPAYVALWRMRAALVCRRQLAVIATPDRSPVLGGGGCMVML